MNRFLESLPLARDRASLRYGAALAISSLALALRFALVPALPSGFPFTTFFPAAIIATFLLGAGPGVLTALLGAAAGLYFFLPPLWSLAPGHSAAFALGVYAAVVTLTILIIHWMQRANIRLRAERQRGEDLAAHAELLFHELQHRVSNNLQMIGSVLSLQRRRITDPGASQALADAVAKLQTIGRIQRQLYNPDGAHLSLDRFLPDLLADLVNAGGRPGIECSVEAKAGVQLEAHAAIPVALIIAEAVANAVEHGFADRETGTIGVHVGFEGEQLLLSVVDDGVGLPAGFDAAASNSLGLKIARTLAEQLGGQFSLTPNAVQGSVAKLHLPIEWRASA
ncbi:DUF4118 domain-containing protein [Sphingomonas sp. MG17]|uniref:histidine kinase n=1 Tax=Sphingomonas tagetis TaxID=2949092 RepID=A0A9X2KLB1_9SPHN|nr:histidine kinase dimerization/phosphoacceptor domain -containing protein [Sphingomonas tagetis]MCP3730241.1 DUF4118 domain-containing protein [Sphingomonas tagetis]